MKILKKLFIDKLSYIATLCLILATVSSCNKSANNSKDERNDIEAIEVRSKNNNLNISLFLDVSDRISPLKHNNETMHYYERDLGYIKSIAECFRLHTLNKKIYKIEDNIQVYLDPNPEDEEINNILKDLRVSLNRKNVTREMIDSIDINYFERCKKLYLAAIEDNNYIGSDIWGFFKRKVKDYCIRKNQRNVLVILTDGYAFHKDNAYIKENKSSYLLSKLIQQNGLINSDWEEKFEKNGYGFITETTDLSELEVLVLGINAYNKTPFEEDVIRRYWSDWLSNMGIKKYEIKSSGLPANMDGVIKKFILQPDS